MMDETYSCLCCRVDARRGGKISSLLKWDLFALLLSVGAIFLLRMAKGDKITIAVPGTNSLSVEAASEATSAWAEEIYWGKVLYSFLSVPFFLFIVPGVNKLLTHSIPTGYNRNGRVLRIDIMDVEG